MRSFFYKLVAKFLTSSSKNANFWKAFSKNSFLKQVSKILSNLTKRLCTSWKLRASYIVINRKLFKFCGSKNEIISWIFHCAAKHKNGTSSNFFESGTSVEEIHFCNFYPNKPWLFGQIRQSETGWNLLQATLSMMCNKRSEIMKYVSHQIFFLNQVEKKTSE